MLDTWAWPCYPSFFPAGRTEVDFSDLFQTFKSLNIDQEELLDYFKSVDTGESLFDPVPPSLPIPCSHRHVYSGGAEQLILRKNLQVEDKEGSAGEGEGEGEEEEEEQWEELPSHLPPLPQIVNKTGKDESWYLLNNIVIVSFAKYIILFHFRR